MPPPDPLATLARLRRFEVAAARRHLAERLAAMAEAESRRDAAAAALAAEAATGDGAAYAAWLPRGRAMRDRTAAALGAEEQRLAAARVGLTAARTAKRVVGTLRDQRAAEARREAEGRAQAAIDEAAARRRE